MVRRLDLRGEQCTAPVSGWCLDVKWMFGIEGWNEGLRRYADAKPCLLMKIGTI